MDLKSFLLKHSFYSADEIMLFIFKCVSVSLFYQMIKILFHLTYIILDTVLLLIVESLYVGLCIVFYFLLLYIVCLWYVQNLYLVKY
jgi:hypothetical protein